MNPMFLSLMGFALIISCILIITRTYPNMVVGMLGATLSVMAIISDLRVPP